MLKASPEQKSLVVIVSADKDSRLLFTTLLEAWGFRTTEVETIEILLTDESEIPDVILFDIGITFAAEMEHVCRLRSSVRFGTVPVLLVSGWTLPHSRPTALANGANEYLVKPVNFDLLEISLRRFTGSSSYMRQI